MTSLRSAAQTLCQAMLLGVLLLGDAAGPAQAQGPDRDDSSSVWRLLPENTTFAIRCPDGEAFADALLNRTKLGAIMFSERRREMVADLFEKMGEAEEEESSPGPIQLLARYGFEPTDLLDMLRGESGFALLATDHGGGANTAVAIAWLSPGEDLAVRAFETIARAVEENQDDDYSIRRTDVELAGRNVMQLDLPQVEYEYTEDFVLPDDYDELSEEEQEEAWENAEEQYESSAVETVSYSALILAEANGRLLLSYVLDEFASEEPRESAEWASISLARLLNAMDAGEADSGLLTAMSLQAQVESVMAGSGLACLEVLGNVQALMSLVPIEQDEAEEFQKAMEVSGMDQVGPFALRVALDGAILKMDGFVTAAAPRSGLLAILDQPEASTDPPAWVPANVLGYGKMSFDLGRVYEVIKAEFAEFGAGAGFQMAEAQVQGMAGATLSEVLRSLGTQHHMLKFEPDLSPAQLAAAAEEDFSPFTERQAVVWKLFDDEPWPKILKAIEPFTTLSDAVEASEEQGFRGYRFENANVSGGLFLGKGYLVLGIGEGVLTPTLSAINNPPVGEDSRASSPLYERATALMDPQSCHLYEITDGQRSAQTAFSAMRTMMEQILEMQRMGGDDFDDPDSEGLEWLQVTLKMLPTDLESENLFGVSVAFWRFEDDGIVLSSASELPPPD